MVSVRPGRAHFLIADQSAAGAPGPRLDHAGQLILLVDDVGTGFAVRTRSTRG